MSRFFLGGGGSEKWLIGNKNSVCQKRSQKIFQRFCHRGPTYEQSLTLNTKNVNGTELLSQPPMERDCNC